MSGPRLPRLHLVTDDAVLRREDLDSCVREVLRAGGERLALHIRGPRCSGAEVFAITERFLPVARETGSMLLVNDRVDVALAAGADGVHLGQRSLPADLARQILGGGATVGVSTHSPPELREAEIAGADYVFSGPIHETSSHPGQAGRGLQALAGDAGGRLRVLAIGGIDVGRVAGALAAGAYGVAVLGGIWAEPHPPDAVIRYLDALQRGSGDM